MIKALASHFGRNIAKLTLSKSITSTILETLFNSIPANCFLLIEDIDAIFTGRNTNDKYEIDFSTLLNCLDGVSSQSGLVIFMTTNHFKELEKALVRPGRVDVRIKFDYTKEPEIRSALELLAEDYVSEHEAFFEAVKSYQFTIASLQQYIFDCIQMEEISLMKNINQFMDLIKPS